VGRGRQNYQVQLAGQQLAVGVKAGKTGLRRDVDFVGQVGLEMLLEGREPFGENVGYGDNLDIVR